MTILDPELARPVGWCTLRTTNQITLILDRARTGDPAAAAELLPLVYDELRRLAAHRLASERQPQTLQPTALVHEAWLKIAATDERAWQGRQHFLAAAAEAMRRILVDRARRSQTAKRGGGAEHVDAAELDLPTPAPAEHVLAMDEALTKFAKVEPRKAELVNLRYFVGLTFEETAEALGIAVPTAKQWWAYARAWLRVEMSATPAVGSAPVTQRSALG